MKRVTLLGAIFLLVATTTQAQNYKLRTVVIYSFTRYIHWPENYEQGNFDIRVLGESPMLEELEEMASMKKVDGRDIVVTKIESLADIDDTCNILFVPSDQSSRLADILRKLSNKSTLVVTEEPGLGARGSDVNFVDKDGKLAFELNQAALHKRKLKASTELTRLAILI